MNELLLKNVSKSFVMADSSETMQALGEVDICIHDGEFVSIVGPSGCGKSTILRLIAGLIVPTTGEIFLNNKKVEGTDKQRGMVFQKPTLFPWLTVEQNVSFSLALDHKVTNEEKEEVRRLLEMMGLEDFASSFPAQLSGGMAQRVALIRTMINRPNVFLMDEPLGALDAFTRMKIQDEIIRLGQSNQHIMIMVTHDVDEAIYMSDRVIVMEARPGRIKRIFSIDMPHPRNRTDLNFVNYRNEIMKTLNI